MKKSLRKLKISSLNFTSFSQVLTLPTGAQLLKWLAIIPFFQHSDHSLTKDVNWITHKCQLANLGVCTLAKKEMPILQS